MGNCMVTLERSCSSSIAGLVVVRTMSPKSYGASPGITVSRSITQMPSPVVSSNMTLLNLVSLWVTRSGRFASSNTPVMDLRASAKSISDLNHANAFAGSVIQHDVVELGVVVGHAFRQVRIQQHTSDGFTRECEVNFRSQSRKCLRR